MVVFALYRGHVPTLVPWLVWETQSVAATLVSVTSMATTQYLLEMAHVLQ